MCSDFLYNFETFPISRRIERHKIDLRRSSPKIYSCQILSILSFLEIFSKNTQISDFVKIRPVEEELFHEGKWMCGLTDKRDEDNSRASQFCERP